MPAPSNKRYTQVLQVGGFPPSLRPTPANSISGKSSTLLHPSIVHRFNHISHHRRLTRIRPWNAERPTIEIAPFDRHRIIVVISAIVVVDICYSSGVLDDERVSHLGRRRRRCGIAEGRRVRGLIHPPDHSIVPLRLVVGWHQPLAWPSPLPDRLLLSHRGRLALLAWRWTSVSCACLLSLAALLLLRLVRRSWVHHLIDAFYWHIWPCWEGEYVLRDVLRIWQM